MHRKLLIDRLEKEPEIRVLLIESVCTDQMVIYYTHIVCLVFKHFLDVGA